ncbi:MAG: hypothetical protein IJ710_10095 [Prevotella sp.]|nr:hypothetical protein [Prevotella sp.]
MQRRWIVAIGAIALLVAACGEKNVKRAGNTEAISTHKSAKGDSTVYGLACDGCTDSILVFLPYSGGDPDTFDIIYAHQHQRVFGRPHIGDELAVIVNPEDKDEALTVINLETLKGEWCYRVMPTMRNIESMPKRMQRRMLEQMPDSIKQQFFVPREFGFKLKRDYTASPIGLMRSGNTSDDQSPVEYPKLKWYNEWRIYNGRIILTQNMETYAFTSEDRKTESDTADIVLLRSDTLVLQFRDHTQGYYLRVDTTRTTR